MRFVLVHGWAAGPSRHWFSWLKKELEARGHTLVVPDLPGLFKPEFDAWIAATREAVGTIDNDTVFVTHSIGAPVVAHLLQEAQPTEKARAWLSVAALVLPRYGKLFPSFFEHAIDGARVRKHVREIIEFHDPKDRWAPFANAAVMRDTCGARVVECPKRGHFNDLDLVFAVPEVLASIIALEKQNL
jgi:predicted alpha/beta hydrolase family esterase